MSRAERRRPIHPLLAAALLSLLGVLALAGIKSYRELGAARAREARLEAEIRAVEAKSERLAVRIRALQSDPATLEREVRQSLRWVRPGELVLNVPEPEPAPPVAAAGEGASDAEDGAVAGSS